MKGAVGSLLVAIAIGVWGFQGVWSVARADVENLKRDYRELAPLKESVAKMNVETANLSRRVDEVRGDIAEIKRGQEEVQRDIKQLLRNTG